VILFHLSVTRLVDCIDICAPIQKFQTKHVMVPNASKMQRWNTLLAN